MYKYLELSKDIENKIKMGDYRDGDKIPSIRTLTEVYECNKSTVINALKELEIKHILYSLPKSGYYVVKKNINHNKENKVVLDFDSSALDPKVFPYLDFQHCINQAIDIYKNELFICDETKEIPSLIDVIQKQLGDYQVFTNEKNIFITSGIIQTLSILVAMPFPNNNETILIEQPSYDLFIDYLEVNNKNVVGIKRNNQGIDLEELERIFKEENIKFFYTMPRYHNPLGTSYSNKQKKEILKLAEKYDVYIVEDDYLADLEQDTKADPMFAFDTSKHVIYLKSYSKVIFPGLRIGVIVIPNKIIEVFTKYKKVSDVDSTSLFQEALQIYIKNGMFKRNKEKIRNSHVARAKILKTSLEKYMNERNIDKEKEYYKYNILKNQCLHTYIELDELISSEKIISKLKKNDIIVATANKNYLESFKDKELLLKINVSNVSEEYIDKGISEIIKAIDYASEK